MCGGWLTEYTWTEGQKQCGSLPAPRYIERLMGWVEAQLYDIALFPK